MTDDDLLKHLLDIFAACAAAPAGEQLSAGRARLRRMVDANQTRLLAESNAYLEAGIYGRGKPTDIYPDWVYEARDAIRRQNENPPHYLPELLAILGWQGGTYHQALKAVQRLVGAEKDAAIRSNTP